METSNTKFDPVTDKPAAAIGETTTYLQQCVRDSSISAEARGRAAKAVKFMNLAISSIDNQGLDAELDTIRAEKASAAAG